MYVITELTRLIGSVVQKTHGVELHCFALKQLKPLNKSILLLRP